MDALAQLLINGIALGSVYALAALGFVIVYSATSVVNFAAGQFVMLGTFIGVTTIVNAQLPAPIAYPLAIAAMAVFGVLFYFVIHLPLQKRPVVSVIIGTVAVGIALQNAALLIWGPWPSRIPSPFGDGTLSLGNSVVSVHALATIAITAVLIALLYLLLYRTGTGRAMRAIAQDTEAARLMGLPVTLLLGLAWVLAAVFASFAGLLVAPMWFADVNMGDPIALKAFAATIIGGFGNVPGAIVGGLSVGLIEILGASYISSTYKDLLAFGIMILFLLVRPQGIFGERIGERG
ncbi:branched-chain amino acid ABC transporter permease [Chitinasiproducens palmae]|uniref:Amino acid/amide ABC transporter membrane protein 1, HAAT family n=1 Tax=Chitinasiproducens palmae TaxID=1770053 RepID=A0A1H2PRI2_9BURK|nr:branched-chain amino acid ABC transporter permease [Chitinasiproducens palmae]SDV49493.1 amino acid/amide ABC transporter membrane protein 1, HAAT family [Chitinasiproducens palmae]